jgi:hypothetical protein
VARYAVFGYCLQSPIELPELEPAEGVSCDWHLEVDSRPVTAEDAEEIGSEIVYGDLTVRAFSVGHGFRLVFDDTGTFDVYRPHRRIAWHPGAGASDAAVRADLLGRVMALVAHADGHLALHASAVSINGQAIAFVGPKHAGKSTLAMALVRHGARLLTDDLLVVRLGGGRLLATPGVQRVRLWPDSARALKAHVNGEGGAKPVVERLTADQLERNPVPLSACYVLEAARPTSSAPVRRERLTAVHAALTCVRFSKLGALGGGPIGPAVLDRGARLAGHVPMYSLAVQRDLDALDEAARIVVGLHEGRHASPAAAVR